MNKKFTMLRISSVLILLIACLHTFFILIGGPPLNQFGAGAYDDRMVARLNYDFYESNQGRPCLPDVRRAAPYFA
ncbi:MAG: hypothetical protein FJ145_23075 [Deltaproteobacteria bacterium]|nr:hypothetical protein [Deltaproteobacteria bacterium]